MARLKNISGMDKALMNLASSDDKIKRALKRGVKRAGLYLQRESMKIVPVYKGVLRASAFTRDIGFGDNVDVVVGYTAGYAAYVHEDLTKAHGRAFNEKYREEITRNLEQSKKAQSSYYKPRGENQQAKFLEQPAREKRNVLFRIIADSDKDI